MKLWIISDLHQELGEMDWQGKVPKHDAVVLAGDIHATPAQSINYAEHLFEKPVVYVAGNHEFYHANIDDEIAKGRERSHLSPKVRFLENDDATIGGVHFIGATQWTDFLLFGKTFRDLCRDDATYSMPDFSLIRESLEETSKRSRKFTTGRAIARHKTSLAFIGEALARYPELPKVVVTHHAPVLWVHGHVHYGFDYSVGTTRVVCNCKGYDKEGETFDPSFVVDIGNHS